MTSDARNNQIPSLPFASPVSGRSSTVYGMFIDGIHSPQRTQRTQCQRTFQRRRVHGVLGGSRSYALSGSNCGVKSFAAPGTLYSYGARYTIGSARKLPCGGGDGAAHSSVVACHGFMSTSLPHLMLMKKLMMKNSWKSPSPHAA